MGQLPIFIDTARVASLLGCDVAGFLRDRDRLQEHLGFPPPLPGFRRPLRWNARSVTDWIAQAERGRHPAPPPPAAPVLHNVHLLTEARRGRGGPASRT